MRTWYDMTLHLLRDLEAAARIAVDKLPANAARRIACMEPNDIPLLLEDDLAERCNVDGADFLRREIHRLCCDRAGMKAA